MLRGKCPLEDLAGEEVVVVAVVVLEVAVAEEVAAAAAAAAVVAEVMSDLETGHAQLLIVGTTTLHGGTSVTAVRHPVLMVLVVMAVASVVVVGAEVEAVDWEVAEEDMEDVEAVDQTGEGTDSEEETGHTKDLHHHFCCSLESSLILHTAIHLHYDVKTDYLDNCHFYHA